MAKIDMLGVTDIEILRFFWLLPLFTLQFSCAQEPLQQDNLPINQYQLLGSHNSYKRVLDNWQFDYIYQQDPELANAINYAHDTIESQLNLGLRQLEIDLVRDPLGARFSFPIIEQKIKKTLITPLERKELNKPGFKVLHIPDLDVLTHCISFQACLMQMKLWSSEHEDHFPIFVLMNIKESSPKMLDGEHFLTFTQQDFEAVDRHLQQILGDKLFTPDDLKAGFNTVNQAVTSHGWPSRNELAGKFIFIFDGNETQVERYRKRSANTQQVTMFASYPINDPDSAIFIRNNPESEFSEIKRLVEQGYIVRTRSDAKPTDCENKNSKRALFAIKSGAQIISTDCYPGSFLAKKYNVTVSFEQQSFLQLRKEF